MPREVPPLDPGQRDQITRIVSYWSEVHPRRDVPIIQLADGSELTPRDIGHADQEPHSSKGQLMFRVFAAALVDDEVERQESLQEILGDFERDAAEWAGRFR